MSSQKFFRIPFADGGDRASIPDTTDPGGSMSYQQGFGPYYELPVTDPLAKRVPRAETNEYLYAVTDNIRQYQLAGFPEWVTSAQNGGSPVAYSLGACVRIEEPTTSGNWNVYTSIVSNNTATPGTDPTKWALVELMARASQAEANAGSEARKLVTPATMSRAVQRGAWNYAANTGTADALVVTLSPAPADLAALLNAPINVRLTGANAGAVTINVNGLGAVPVRNLGGGDLVRGQFAPGLATICYDGTQFQLLSLTPALFTRGGRQLFSTSGTWVCPAGVYSVYAEVQGGGGSGGSASGSGSAATGGNGGAFGSGVYAVTPGTSYAVTVGQGGAVPAPGFVNGISGGASSFAGLVTANGGSGGFASNSGIQLTVGLNATVSGANVLSLIGSQSQPAYAVGGLIVNSPGGPPPNGPYGDRVGASPSGVPGNNAVAIGQGGNGAIGTFSGGGGQRGYVLLSW